jgi:hypothetical protein
VDPVDDALLRAMLTNARNRGVGKTASMLALGTYDIARIMEEIVLWERFVLMLQVLCVMSDVVGTSRVAAV